MRIINLTLLPRGGGEVLQQANVVTIKEVYIRKEQA